MDPQNNQPEETRRPGELNGGFYVTVLLSGWGFGLGGGGAKLIAVSKAIGDNKWLFVSGELLRMLLFRGSVIQPE